MEGPELLNGDESLKNANLSLKDDVFIKTENKKSDSAKYFRHLTIKYDLIKSSRAISREDFIKFTRRESTKTNMNYCNLT
jgi:hypothetical protein